MKVDVLLGLQWGDEGKGKIVDVLTPNYSVIARFQGGPNAGHTLEFDGIKHVLHTIPSGIFHPDTMNVVGNGVVIDPIILKRELEELDERGVDYKKNLFISKKAHLILPTHKILDAASEAAKGKEKIGSTLKGIGPTYMDKTGRNGLRVGDIDFSDFKAKYQALVTKHMGILEGYDYSELNLDQLEKDWFEGIRIIKELEHIDSEHVLNRLMNEDKSILAEGAQGTLLDIDFGTYPFVTSSNTVTAGACTGLGVAPNRIGEVIGIFKAYCTRVGSGPFPSELNNEEGEKLRKAGNEFGATTGRPRRCGWIDLPALRYAITVNGATQLAMTKADVLGEFDQIKVCTHYEIDGKEVYDFPFDVNRDGIVPVYKAIKGWKADLTGIQQESEFPKELKDYIEYLENELGVPITIVSLGPDRNQTVQRESLMV